MCSRCFAAERNADSFQAISPQKGLAACGSALLLSAFIANRVPLIHRVDTRPRLVLPQQHRQLGDDFGLPEPEVVRLARIRRQVVQLAGRRDIETGSGEFDAMYHVNGESEPFPRDFLDSAMKSFLMKEGTFRW